MRPPRFQSRRPCNCFSGDAKGKKRPRVSLLECQRKPVLTICFEESGGLRFALCGASVAASFFAVRKLSYFGQNDLDPTWVSEAIRGLGTRMETDMDPSTEVIDPIILIFLFMVFSIGAIGPVIFCVWGAKRAERERVLAARANSILEVSAAKAPADEKLAVNA